MEYFEVMSLRMRQRPRHGYNFDFSHPCPECSYVIPIEDQELTGFSKMRCPKCRQEFITERNGPSIALRSLETERQRSQKDKS
jgi:ssDNA-binding Zn-finger/Zn-ribbon topoisomerase 1